MSSTTSTPEVRTTRNLVPGLVAAGVAVALSLLVNAGVDAISPLVVAAAIGAIVANTIGISEPLLPGIQFASKRVLRAGVVLLGFRLSLSDVGDLGSTGLIVVAMTVTATFFGTRWAGRRLGLTSSMSLLVATGFSICGASAIAAVESVADADEEEVTFAIALVTLCGTLAIFVLPIVGNLVGLEGVAYGNWVGASVHDVGQVVAAATPGGDASIEAAVVVKLTRVLLLAPLVAGLSIARNRRAGSSPSGEGGRRPPIVPLFVAGFLVAILIRTSGVVADTGLDVIQFFQTILLAAALFGLGCGVEIARLRKVGGRPLLLGLFSWALVAGIAFVGTRLIAV